MPTPGWNVYWSNELNGSASNLFATSSWRPWRTNTSDVYITPSPLSGGKCKMYLESPPSGKSTVIAGGYTYGLSINPSSMFNGEGSYRNRWTAIVDFYPTERPFPRSNVADAHVAVFIRVQPNRTWAGHPNQTRFGCFINGKISNPRAALQFTGDRVGDSSTMARKLSSFDLSEDPFGNLTQKYRIQIIEEEWRSPLSGWTLQWGAEVWNRTTDTKIGEKKWVTANTLGVSNVAIPALSGSRFAMGLGPGTDGTVNVDSVGTAYWHFT